MAAYIISDGALSALQNAGYATVIWVNSKVNHFNSEGLMFVGTQFGKGI